MKKQRFLTAMVMVIALIWFMAPSDLIADSNVQDIYTEVSSQELDVEEDLLIARGRSSSSRSSSSRSSYSRSSSSKSSSSKSNKSWGSKSSKTSTKPKAKPMSAADKKAISKAKQSGKYFENRGKATQDFKSKNAGKYPSTYKTQPTTRPSHIPATTSSGGKTYNVTYNSTYGGYGYMGPSGTWMMYDAMRDAAMISLLMNQQGYYVHQPMAAHGTVVHTNNHDWVYVLITVMSVAIIAIGVFVLP